MASWTVDRAQPAASAIRSSLGKQSPDLALWKDINNACRTAKALAVITP